MDRLPTEIYDRIIYYVESFDGGPPIYSPGNSCHWPASYRIRLQGRRALAVLRLVDKAFCRSASRALFRCIIICTKFEPTFICWLEWFSSSQCALYVRSVIFELETGGGEEEEEEEERDRHRYIELPDEVANRLPSLMAKFLNLRAIHIWPSFTDKWERTIKMVPPILRSIANVPFRDLTELRLMVGDTPYLQDLFGNSNHDTAVKLLAQRIQHLNLNGRFENEDNMVGLNMLLNATTGLRSLSLMGDGPDYTRLVLDNIKFGQPPPLNYLELTFIDISSKHLLSLLEQCTEYLRFLSFHSVYLTSGSWLHVLSQVNKNLRLFKFVLTYRISDEDWEKEHQDLEIPLDLFDEEDILKLAWCAHGDIRRQISANRLAAGLEPLSDAITNDCLRRPPLRSVMSETQYRELISRPWDFEEHSDEWKAYHDLASKLHCLGM